MLTRFKNQDCDKTSGFWKHQSEKSFSLTYVYNQSKCFLLQFYDLRNQIALNSVSQILLTFIIQSSLLKTTFCSLQFFGLIMIAYFRTLLQFRQKKQKKTDKGTTIGWGTISTARMQNFKHFKSKFIILFLTTKNQVSIHFAKYQPRQPHFRS